MKGGHRPAIDRQTYSKTMCSEALNACSVKLFLPHRLRMTKSALDIIIADQFELRVLPTTKAVERCYGRAIASPKRPTGVFTPTVGPDSVSCCDVSVLDDLSRQTNTTGAEHWINTYIPKQTQNHFKGSYSLRCR